MNPLQVFPRHPSAPDTYYINGAWAPAAITAVDKRFTTGELAAEYWRHKADADAVYEGLRVGTFGGRVANGWFAEEFMQKRLDTLHRFCTQPAHDDGPA